MATFTGLPRPFVAVIRQRMIQAELWTDVDVHCDHWQPDEHTFDSLAFRVDVLIAEGLIIRRWDEEAGDYWYCATEFAQNEEESLEM